MYLSEHGTPRVTSLTSRSKEQNHIIEVMSDRLTHRNELRVPKRSATRYVCQNDEDTETESGQPLVNAMTAFQIDDRGIAALAPVADLSYRASMPLFRVGAATVDPRLQIGSIFPRIRPYLACRDPCPFCCYSFLLPQASSISVS